MAVVALASLLTSSFVAPHLAIRATRSVTAEPKMYYGAAAYEAVDSQSSTFSFADQAQMAPKWENGMYPMNNMYMNTRRENVSPLSYDYGRMGGMYGGMGGMYGGGSESTQVSEREPWVWPSLTPASRWIVSRRRRRWCLRPPGYDGRLRPWHDGWLRRCALNTRP